MKGKTFRRILSTVLSAVMVMSVFAVGSVSSVSAADDPKPTEAISVVIKDVTRKYTIANDLLDAVNSYRSSSGAGQLTADKYLFNQAMERAAQLALNPDTYDLNGESYEENDQGIDVIDVINVDMTSPLTTAQILDNIISDSVTFHRSSDYVKDALTNTDMSRIGVGAAYVYGNENTLTKKNKLFVCIRLSKSKNVVTAYDPAQNDEDEVVDQATVISPSVFNGVEKTVIFTPESSSSLDPARVKLNKDSTYKIYDFYTYDDLTTSHAYLAPAISGSGIKATNVVSTSSAMNPAPSTYCTGFEPTANSCTVTLKYPNYASGIGNFERTITMEANGEYTDPVFSAEDVELEFTEVYYQTDGTNVTTPKPAVVSVHDHNTGELLVDGTDYYVYYYFNYKGVPSKDSPVKAYVWVKGLNRYSSLTKVPVYYSIILPPETLTVTMRASNGTGDYNNTFYTDRSIEVLATPTKSDTSFTFDCTDPDGKAVSGISGMSGSDGRYNFTPEKAGQYTVTAHAVNGDETADQPMKIDVVADTNAELTLSEYEVEEGATVTVTAAKTGGYGTLTYEFRDEFGKTLEKLSDNSAKYVAEDAGVYDIKCVATDENGRSKTKSVTVTVLSGERFPTVTGRNLTLGGEIGINIFMKLPSKDYTVVLNGVNGEVTYDATDDNCYISSSTPYGSEMMGYHKFSYTVAAADIDDSVTLSLYDKSGNAVALYANDGQTTKPLGGNVYTTSVGSYFDAAGSASGSSEKVKNLAASMYSYGSYASHFFNKTDISKREFQNTEDMQAVTAAVIEQGDYAARIIDKSVLPEGVTVKGYSLVLEDKTTMRVYVNVTSTSKAKFAVYENGVRKEVELQKNNVGTYFQLQNISANKLGTPVTFEISDDENNVFTLSCCPLSYAYIVLRTYEGTTKNQDLCDLMRAMYCYYKAANAYFGY